MSEMTREDRLLTFEVGGGVYAIPIAGVLEVAEVEEMACIPMIPPSIAGVVNHHGDALPVIRRASLLDLQGDELGSPEHILVICDRSTDSARMGLPVDCVLGLVDGEGATACGPDPIAERRTIDGRVASVLDPRRLVERAREVIEGALAHSG